MNEHREFVAEGKTSVCLDENLIEELRLGLKMWQEIQSVILNSDTDTFSHNWLTTYKYKFCVQHELKWQGSCFFCSYASDFGMNTNKGRCCIMDCSKHNYALLTLPNDGSIDACLAVAEYIIFIHKKCLEICEREFTQENGYVVTLHDVMCMVGEEIEDEEVHEFWFDFLEGKKGWFANDIATLNIISEERHTEELVGIDGVYSVCHRGSALRPFHSELREDNWKYFKEDKK